MADRICPECGQSVSEFDMTCPNCGYILVSEKKKPNIGKGIIAVITIAIFIALIVGGQIYQMYSKVDILNSDFYMGYDSKKLEYEGRDLTWNSSDWNTAKVSEGVVIGQGEGTAVITAKSKLGKTDKVTVHVANLIDDWEWDSILMDGKQYTNPQLKGSIKVTNDRVRFDTSLDIYEGYWKLEKEAETGIIYRFETNGDIDFRLIISDDVLGIFPYGSSDLVFFYNRK